MIHDATMLRRRRVRLTRRFLHRPVERKRIASRHVAEAASVPVAAIWLIIWSLPLGLSRKFTLALPLPLHKRVGMPWRRPLVSQLRYLAIPLRKPKRLTGRAYMPIARRHGCRAGLRHAMMGAHVLLRLLLLHLLQRRLWLRCLSYGHSIAEWLAAAGFHLGRLGLALHFHARSDSEGPRPDNACVIAAASPPASGRLRRLGPFLAACPLRIRLLYVGVPFLFTLLLLTNKVVLNL